MPEPERYRPKPAVLNKFQSGSAILWHVYEGTAYMMFGYLKTYQIGRCDVTFIGPMHRNKPNITYLLIYEIGFVFESPWYGM